MTEPTPPTPLPAPEPPPATPARELPRGCNPLTFGVIAATIQMAIILWLLRHC